MRKPLSVASYHRTVHDGKPHFKRKRTVSTHGHCIKHMVCSSQHIVWSATHQGNLICNKKPMQKSQIWGNISRVDQPSPAPGPSNVKNAEITWLCAAAEPLDVRCRRDVAGVVEGGSAGVHRDSERLHQRTARVGARPAQLRHGGPD